jgi:hypothetical protein
LENLGDVLSLVFDSIVVCDLSLSWHVLNDLLLFVLNNSSLIWNVLDSRFSLDWCLLDLNWDLLDLDRYLLDLDWDLLDLDWHLLDLDWDLGNRGVLDWCVLDGGDSLYERLSKL